MDTTNLHGGINKDLSPINHPSDSPSFALNAIREATDGNMHNYQSEPSNKLEVSLSYRPIGYIYGESGEKYVFSTDEVNSEIGVYDRYGNYEVLVNDSGQENKLNFSASNPITGEYRVRKGCNQTIYWRDSRNDDRWLDRNELDLFKNELGEWDLNKFTQNPLISIPKVDLLQVNDSGGNLPLGVYSIQLEYVDESLNSIYRAPITSPVNIYDEDFEGSYYLIDGGYNIEQFSAADGGVPPSNKSISYQFSNLDTSYKFLQINVIRLITGDGQAEEAFTKGNLLPITSDTLNYTLTGFDPNEGDTLVDVTSLRTELARYKSSKVMEQVQNRLVRANVVESRRDYTNYQRIVNEIEVSPVVKESDPEIQFIEGNAKNPRTHYEWRTFAGDEIYALAIEFYYPDGSVSPAFHIPGRAKIAGLDDAVFPYDPNDADQKRLPIKDEYERWEIYNTGNSTQMGYYEGESLYPLDLDCEDNFIFGDLAGTPIRHHKIPGRTAIPIYNRPNLITENATTYLIGLKFDNVVYPDDEIIGHKFLVVPRTETTKTVLDTGILNNARSEDNTYVNNGPLDFIGNDPRVKIFMSPKSMLKIPMNGQYFKNLGELVKEDQDLVSSGFISTTTKPLAINVLTARFDASPVFPLGNTYINYDSDLYVSTRSIQPAAAGFDQALVNDSRAIDAHFFNLEEDFLITNDFALVSNQRYFRPYENLSVLTYQPLHHNILTLDDSQEVFGGDCFISEFEIIDVAIGYSESSSVQTTSHHIHKIYLESEINFDLTHGGTESCTTVYKKAASGEEQFDSFILPKLAILSDDGNEWVLKAEEEICKNYYAYNLDYSKIYLATSSVPLPITYDFCNPCLEEKKNRIIFSPQSFDEEIVDLYRVNYIDDYIDIPAHKGEITGLKYKNNQLFVHTTQTTFILQPNPQFVATDQNTAYLSTGDFLSIPPYELNQTDLGYGGMQNLLGNTNSEYGYIWVDSERGEIHGLMPKLDKLSVKGLNNWFKENLPFKIDRQWKENTNTNYPFKDQITHPNGIGIDLVYDKRFERLIITKRDFSAPDDFDYENPNYEELCDESWTISYSFKYQSWTSWHSYKPSLFLADETYFYSTQGNNLYKHLHKDSYGVFYEKSYPFVIESVHPKGSTSTIESILYHNTVEELINQEFVERMDIDYDSLWVYTGRQSTGKLSLTLIDHNVLPYGNLNLDTNVKSVIKTDENSKVSNLWDYATSSSIISSKCEDRQVEEGFTDVVPTNVDFTKSPYESGVLKDKFCKVRFWFNGGPKLRMTHHFMDINEKQSFR